MNNHNEELFDRAVVLIRRGTSYPELISELEGMGPTGGDVRVIISEAGRYAEKMQKESFAAAVEAAHRGESHFEISKKLTQLGFHPYDSDLISARAIKKAQGEMAQETVSEEK